MARETTYEDLYGTFAIGESGMSFVESEWVPKLEEVQAQIFQLADDVDNWTEPLIQTRAALIHSTELHFDFESDPYDKPWTPLEPDYEAWKQNNGGAGEKILHLEGSLEAAAIKTDSWIIAENEIFFDVGKLPTSDDGFNYGAAHQAGTLDSELGGVLHNTRLEQKKHDAAETGISLQTKAVGTGRGHALPQRQFIGGDEETIAEIEEIFLNWLDGLIAKDIPKREYGKSVGKRDLGMGSNVLGSFPIISFTSKMQPIIRTPHGPRFGKLQP